MSGLNDFVSTLRGGGTNSQLLIAYLSEQEKSLFVLFGLTGVCVFILISATAILLSHRIAGPLHRLNKHLKLIEEAKNAN